VGPLGFFGWITEEIPQAKNGSPGFIPFVGKKSRPKQKSNKPRKSDKMRKNGGSEESWIK
jgi:hypothetical protein